MNEEGIANSANQPIFSQKGQVRPQNVARAEFQFFFPNVVHYIFSTTYQNIGAETYFWTFAQIWFLVTILLFISFIFLAAQCSTIAIDVTGNVINSIKF